jgi:site-specific DNA-cytosine methylase
VNLTVAAVVKSITWADQLPQSSNKNREVQEKLKIDLSSWRNAYSVGQAKKDSVNNNKNMEIFTMADLCSGGCLDTIAAMRVGFKPVWSSEIDQAQARMYKDLTGNECLGDTFGAAVKNADRVHYIKSGQPCTDWARSGNGKGASGETGWMFVKQTEVILSKMPQAFRLEISDNAVNVNEGQAVKLITAALEAKYALYQRLIEMWRFGDPSNRKRLFIVGFDLRLGQVAHDFKWPKPSFYEDNVPVGRVIAVNDDEVPKAYWRHDAVNELEHWNNFGRADKIQVIARQAVGMGPASKPNVIRSWDGLLNGPTTLGGGGRGPELLWISGEPIKRTRMTVPVEYNRAASNPDDYVNWCSSFANGNVDEFVLKCINNGVPQRTSCAIDEQVMRILQIAKSREKGAKIMACAAWKHQPIRNMMFDTGANGCINFRDVERWMLEATESNTKVTVANKQCMEVGLDGILPISVLNTSGAKGVIYSQDLSIETTTANTALELFSFDPFFKAGWGLHISPGDPDGVQQSRAVMYQLATKGKSAVSIPMRYDWTNRQGGFWIDYLIVKDPQPEHHKLLAAYHTDMCKSKAEVAKIKFFDEKSTQGIISNIEVSAFGVDVMVGQHDADRQIRGVKAGLKSDRQKMTEANFHTHYGHLGCRLDCLICRMVKGASRRIRKTVDPHKEQRVAYKFHMDTLTWSDRSSQGNKYCTILRDEASDVFVIFNYFLKSDILDIFENWVDVIRADPAYHDCGYKVMSIICLDNAGEWAHNTANWQRMCERKGVQPLYSCPDRKESAANAERSVGIIEIVTKALLMQNNLPVYWWEACANSGVFLLNRFPTSTMAATNSIDGDRVRPLELFSRFHYSRRQIDRELSYYLPPGTPALVQTTAKGSLVGPKTRWGVAVGMYREQVIFMCPHVLSQFRSKSFSAFRLKDGLNYLQFLGLPEVKTARGRLTIPSDFKETVVIQLPVHNTELVKKTDSPITEVVLRGDSKENPPVISVKERSSELGGEVRVTDLSGQFENTTELAQGSGAHTVEDAGSIHITEFAGVDQKSAKADRVKSRDSESVGECRQLIIDCTLPASVKVMFDRIDAKAALHRSVVTTGTESFGTVCKKMALPFEVHYMYHEWLMEIMGLSAEVLIMSRDKLKPGLRLLYPTGCRWQEIKALGSRKQKRAHHVDFNVEEDAEWAADLWLQRELSSQNMQVAQGGRYCFNIQTSVIEIAEEIEELRPVKDVYASRKKKRIKAVASGTTPAPANVKAAFESQEAMDWVASMNNEFDGLVKLGVFDLGFTKAGLLAEGIDIDLRPAVPCGQYFENKFGVDGQITKHKNRIAIQGHPGNMQKGIHYNETFAATPRESTARIMCAMVVYLNLVRRAFDITKAFCWADRLKGDLMALKYPEGYKQFHKETGEELFIILRKNLYGDPAAGRTFSMQRNKEVLQKFNQKGWGCDKTRMDPCLFVLTKSYDGGVTVSRAWMLVHVDDCDIIAEGNIMAEDILAVCAEIFINGITLVNPEFMLGVRRRVQVDEKGKVESCELDMIAFIEGMYDAFKQHMPVKIPVDPVPPKLFLSKGDAISEAESAAVIKAGYQAAVGMTLWAVRHCHDIGKPGVSMCCRVMAKPSWRAFNAVMQLICWLYNNRTEGIRFSAGGNRHLIGFVDASNKPDLLHDGICQWGCVFMWMGGPVCDISKKLRQVGLSSEHNEYMAMYYAHQQLIWIRQLLQEMGLTELVSLPTVMFADNKAANILSREDVVTHGNQYVALAYHFNKEVQEQAMSTVHFVKSDNNISDMMSKCVEVVVRKRLQGALSGHDLRLIKRMELEVIDIYDQMAKDADK